VVIAARPKRARYLWRLAFGTIAVAAVPVSSAYAQNSAIDDLKGKIFDARMAKEMLGTGSKYCSDLDGKTFYYRVRDRILNLEEFAHSLENLVKAEVFNPAKKRPWNLADAKERWEEVKKQAQDDKQRCDLVRSLPELEQRLQELQQSAAVTGAPSTKE
jgi:hypothetical protein